MARDGERGTIEYEQDGENQTATWEVNNGLVTVSCPQGEKTTQVGGLPAKEAARMMLGELRRGR